MNKKLFSLGVVMALLFALTIPAGAVTDSPADSDAASVENDCDGPGAPSDAPTSEEGTAEDIQTANTFTPDTQVPDTMRIVFNPYRMPAVWNGETTNDAALSEVVFITSRDARPLSLNFSVSGVPAPESEAVPVSSPEELGGERKQAFVWFEFQPFTEGEELVWRGAYVGAENQVAVNDAAGKTVALPAAQDGETVYLAVKAFAEFHIPSGIMWTADDTIRFNICCFFEALESSDAQASGDAEPVEDAQASDDAEATEDAEASDDAEAVDDAQASGDAEATEDAEASGDAEATDDAQASDSDAPSIGDARPVRKPESSEEEQSAETEEPLDDGEASDELVTLTDELVPLADLPTFDDEKPAEGAETVEDAQASDSDAEAVEDAQASDSDAGASGDDAQASDSDAQASGDDAQASDSDAEASGNA